MDGASTDGTETLLSLLGADRHISEPDAGIFDAMNKALALCTGEYVSFLNAGDKFYDDKVLDVVAKEIAGNPGVEFVYGDVYYPGSIRPYSLQPRRLSPFTLFRGTVCHQAWFVKKNVYRDLGGFDPRLKYKGDYDALLRMIYLYRVSYRCIPRCVVNYCGGGFSERNFEKSRQEFEHVRRKYISPRRALFYSIFLTGIDVVRSNSYYQILMRSVNYLRATRAWKKA